jgi:hypothetical protein
MWIPGPGTGPQPRSAGLANGLGCLHISAQIAAMQTSDVGLSFIDVSPQRCGVQLGTVFFQPRHPADHLVPHIAQSPDQYRGLSCIALTHHHHGTMRTHSVMD